MVNFVGFHNPGPGAFFIFEIVSTAGNATASSLAVERGDLLFGHFTARTNGGGLVSNQSGLTIELIAWDPDKQFYNFYELVDGTWFYRGDSKDILDDYSCCIANEPRALATPLLRMPRNGGLRKGISRASRLVLTGPAPSLGSLKPDPFVKAKLADLGVPRAQTSHRVGTRLADSPGYRKVLAARNMQERLRPLFCPVELNIESDSEPFDDRKPTLHIPSGFFSDPRLGTADISVQRQHYDDAIQKLGSRLPQTPGRDDADHGWLTPVKAQSDIVEVDALIEQGVVDKEFAADVLAVDSTNPVFSKSRCGLLKLVPANGGPDFVARFQSALRGTSADGAAELLGNLTNPERTAAFHQKQSLAFLANCKQRATDPAAVLEWTRILAQHRAEVSIENIPKSRDTRGGPDRLRFVPPGDPRPSGARHAGQ
jgi:hypothetical protein